MLFPSISSGLGTTTLFTRKYRRVDTLEIAVLEILLSYCWFVFIPLLIASLPRSIIHRGSCCLLAMCSPFLDIYILLRCYEFVVRLLFVLYRVGLLP